MKLSRRLFLQYAGINVALPLLDSVIPYRSVAHATEARQRFVGIFYPNGAYMPNAANGDFTWGGALKPLVDAGFKNNTMLFRGLYNGFYGRDQHWQSTAGFLSCEPIQLGNPSAPACGKSLDQYIAELQGAEARTYQVGGLYNYHHPGPAHEPYSMDYLNRIAWKSATQPLSPISSPTDLYATLFGTGSSAQNKIKYMLAQKKSVLDLAHKDAERMAKRLPAEYKPVLENYMDSVRDLETQLSSSKTCETTMASPTGSWTDPDLRYRERFRLIQEMLVLAFQCGLTNSVTMMYSPSIGTEMVYDTELPNEGLVIEHHAAAHHQGYAPSIERVKLISRLHVELLADLLQRLKDRSLLDSTLVLYGTDMSDGDKHLPDNLPTLLCGGGSDLKWGQEIGSRSSRRPLSDLHVDILKLFGSSKSSFGSGEMKSTGKSLPIRV